MIGKDLERKLLHLMVKFNRYNNNLPQRKVKLKLKLKMNQLILEQLV